MEGYVLVGYRKLSFIGNDGQPVNGYKLNFECKDNFVFGVEFLICNCFNDSLLPPDLLSCLGNKYLISYRSRDGKSNVLTGMVALQ